MSSGGGTTTTVQNSAPWPGAQPYLSDVMRQAQGTYYSQQGQNGYAPFNTVVTPSANTNLGLDLTAQRAINGSPVTKAADSSLTSILNGSGLPSPGDSTLQSLTRGYSDPGAAVESAWADPSNINPYLTAQYDAASKPVIDSINAQFGQAGRTGSAANQDVLARNLGDLSANIFSTGYENAANRSLSAAGQLSSGAANQANVRGTAANNLNTNANTQAGQKIQASALAPSLAGADYTDLQNLLNVGGAQDAQSAAQIQDLLNRWNYSNQQPWNILQQYGGAVSGLGSLMPGSTSGSTTQPGQSMIPSLLGSAITALPFFL